MSTEKNEISLDPSNMSLEEQAKLQTETQAVVANDETRVEVSEVDNTNKSTDDVRPDWLPEKFKSAEDMAKAYSELEKKQSTPEEQPAEDKTYENETNSGMENLKEGKNYLFISNHRDIAMDPAFVNYMLYHAGFETLKIAIGDNLLKKPFLTDLMRLNKSFIVQRSLKGRELLQSLKLLSEYIHQCVATGDSVWIAQREGRAKDGIDKTDPALLKMLAMSQRDLPLRESLSDLNIGPVCIS